MMGRRTHSDVPAAPHSVDKLVAFDGYAVFLPKVGLPFVPRLLVMGLRSLQPEFCFGMRTFTATPSAVRDLWTQLYTSLRSSGSMGMLVTRVKPAKSHSANVLAESIVTFFPWLSMRY